MGVGMGMGVGVGMGMGVWDVQGSVRMELVRECTARKK